MDLLPTFCKLADAKMPKQKIDGYDITNLLLGDRKERSQNMSRFCIIVADNCRRFGWETGSIIFLVGGNTPKLDDS